MGTTEKIALVIQGGGTRAAYAAGALDVLMKEGVSFPLVVGTSAGALLGVNYISGDRGRSAALLTYGMDDRKLLSPLNLLRKGSIYDFHYLFYVLPNKGLPFNYSRFRTNEAGFYAVSTSLITGKAHLAEKGDKDFWAGLAASCSLPFLSKPVPVGDDVCLDGGIIASVPFHEALSLGASRLVCILTREKGYRKAPVGKRKRILARGFYGEYPLAEELLMNSANAYNESMEELDRLEKEGKAFLLYPSKPPRVSVAERDGRKLLPLVVLGASDMSSRMEALRAFLAS